MIRTQQIEKQTLEKIIDSKIDMFEQNFCGLLNFIEDSVKRNNSLLVYESVNYLADTLESLAEHYIFKATMCIDDDEIFLSYIGKAAIVSPELEVKKSYNFINPEVGVLVNGNNIGINASIQSGINIQIPNPNIFNQTLKVISQTYQMEPDLIIERIMLGELKEEMSKFDE